MTFPIKCSALLGNMLNEWLGPRINCAAAGVLGLVGFLVCAFAPVFGVYFASFVFLIGVHFILLR